MSDPTPAPASDQEFATVMRCIQKILTMPVREFTQVPTEDLKAFARLVTSQCERVVELETALASSEARREELRVERDKLGEALEAERARTCRDCGRALGSVALQVCSACLAIRHKPLLETCRTPYCVMIYKHDGPCVTARSTGDET